MAPNSSRDQALRGGSREQQLELRAGQIRLLFENSITGIAVTTLAAPLLAYFLSSFVKPWILFGWVAYMLLVSVGRYVLSRRYQAAPVEPGRIEDWGIAFAVSAGLAGTGWGSAGVFLFPQADLTSQMFLVFVIGGMMLGGAVLLAPRPEAFLAFLIPTICRERPGSGHCLRYRFETWRAHIC